MKKSYEILYWTPRILCIIAILFISLFALDAFDHGETIWQKLGAFTMHLIPSFVLTAILIIAWKWERIGGGIFLLIGLIATPWIFKHNYDMNQSIGLTIGIICSITLPFIIVGLSLIHI